MPIEIKELVVRAVVDDGGRSTTGLDEAQAQAIVEACVRQVLRALKRKQER